MSRGSLVDVFFLMVVVFVFVLITIVSAAVWEQIEEDETFNETTYNAGVQDTYADAESALYGLDGIIVTFYLLMNIGAVISAFFIRSHPIFFIIALFIMAFMVLVSVILGNVYYEFANSLPVLQAAANSFPLVYQLFTWLPAISCVLGGLIAVVMYGQPQPQGGGYTAY